MQEETSSTAGSENRLEAGRTLVLGLGNDLLRDDGVGLCAARLVARGARGRAELALACVATIDLLPIIAGYNRVIVVDAFVSDEVPAGTPVRAGPDELPAGFGARSLHTLPFSEMLALGRRLGYDVPRSLVVHGLSAADTTTFGRDFTPAVARAWRGWAERILSSEFEWPRPSRSPRPS